MYEDKISEDLNNEPTPEPTVDLEENHLLKNGTESHKFTKEDSIKGGQVRSERKRIAATLNPKRYCTSNCALYEKCWAKVVLNSDVNTDAGRQIKEKLWDESKNKWRCALKLYGERMSLSTANIYLKGKEGLYDTIRRVLIDLLLKTNDSKDYKAIVATANTLMKASEVFYGSKNKTEVSMKKDVIQEFIDMVNNKNKKENNN
jgi:enoyl reductase-like protein